MNRSWLRIASLGWVLSLGLSYTAYAQTKNKVAIASDESIEIQRLEDSKQFQMYREFDEVSRWCMDVVRYLDAAQRQAYYKQTRGYMEEAVDILIEGLKRAHSSGSNYSTGLMTKKALFRGIEQLESLRRNIGRTERGQRTTILYGGMYFDFIRKVAQELDVPYWIPYERCGRCQSKMTEEFERTFIRFVGLSISLPLDSLIMVSGGMIYPVGPSAAYLNTLKSTAYNAALDLQSALWSAPYSCAIEDLRYLSQSINPNDPDVDYQVRWTYEIARPISNELLENSRCDRRHRDDSPKHERPRRPPGSPGGIGPR